MRPAGPPLRAWRRPHGALICAAVSMMASALYWGWFQRHYRPMSDANHYDAIARNIAAGKGFTHVFPGLKVHATAFRPPLYPSLLGLVYRLTGSHVASGLALNVALGAAVCVAVYAFVHEFAGEGTAVTAGILVAVYPPLLANNVALLTEPLGMVLLFAALWALTRSNVWAAGAIGGLFALTWTSGQFFCVIIAGWTCVHLGWRRALRLVVAALVVVTPWVVRNEVRMGSATINTSNGFNLTATYSAEANAKETFFVDETVDPRYDTVRWRKVQQNEAAWDRALRRHGIEGLVAHPGHVFTLMHRNIAIMAERKPALSRLTDVLDGRARTMRDIGARIFPFVSIAGLLGLATARRRRGVDLLLGVASTFVLLDLATVMAPRLRGVFDATCCIGVALLVATMRKGGQRPPLGADRL
ncbi:MAG: hypothetical protein NVS3B21_01800 [Acidimicrobiales bacterium]